MARLDPVAERLASFCQQLRKLHRLAGEPALRDLSRAMPDGPSKSTISAILNAKIKKAPRAEFVRQFVAACVECAEQTGSTLPEDESKWTTWRKRHGELQQSVEELRRARKIGQQQSPPRRQDGRAVGDWDPFDLGVHRAIDPGDHAHGLRLTALPRYVERAHDVELRNLLGPSERSMMIVLVGGSSTGKTRACYEAVRALHGLSDWPVHLPADAPELAQMLGGSIGTRSILWLNETQRYLEGEHGQAAAAGLQRLLVGNRMHVLVIGSMWPKYWLTFTARPEVDGLSRRPVDQPDGLAQVRELLGLSRVHRIDVPDDFTSASNAERAGLTAQAALDPRLHAALQTAGPAMKVVQILAGGVMMLDRYEHTLDSHSRAAITAAMDARRVGCRAPLPPAFLKKAIPGYLSAEQRAAGDDWFTSALANATEIVRGVRALAPTRTESGMGPPDGYVLHDYLDQHAHTARRAALLPAECWDAVANHVTDADDLNALSAAADGRGLYQCSVRLATQAADAGNADAMCRLGTLNWEAGHRQRAEQWMRCAIEAGSGWAVGRLVTWLASIGREDEMEPIVRDAAERGHAQSIAELAWRLEGTGRSDEATAWEERLQRAAESGDREAMLRWTGRLRSSGRPELEVWLLRDAEAGISEAIVDIYDRGMWRHCENPEVERVVGQAVDRGDARAMLFLHKLYTHAGRAEDVDRMWARAAETGSAYAMRILAARLAHAGQDNDAEHWLRRAAHAGDANAMRILAARLAHAGQDNDAEHWLRRAAHAGDANAMCILAGRLAHAGRDEDAEHWLRLAAHADDSSAVTLGALWAASDQGRQEARLLLGAIAAQYDSRICMTTGIYKGAAVERWWRDAAEAGSSHAMRDLVRQLEEAGRHQDLEQWLRCAIEAAIPDTGSAMHELTTLLHGRGRGQEAEQLRRFGIEPGGRTAHPW